MNINALYNSLSSIEKSFDNYLIFGFTIVKIKEIEESIEKFKNKIPIEIYTAKSYLYNKNKENSLELIDKLCNYIQNSIKVCGFYIINTNEIMNIFDMIYANLPADIKEVELLNAN